MKPKKLILSVETSGSLCAVCLYHSSIEFYECSIRFRHIHSEKIIDIIDNVLKLGSANLEDLFAIAISSGPGSFTGLRIGMSAVKGLAFGAGLPIIPVPTFEAIAFQLSASLNDGEEFYIANRVNNEEVYIGKFQINSNSYIFVEDLRIVDKTEFLEMTKNSRVFGNIAANNPGKEDFSYPSAKFVAIWADKFGEKYLTENYDYLEPEYLKEFQIHKGRLV